MKLGYTLRIKKSFFPTFETVISVLTIWSNGSIDGIPDVCHRVPRAFDRRAPINKVEF